jgi:hypothetical protein
MGANRRALATSAPVRVTGRGFVKELRCQRRWLPAVRRCSFVRSPLSMGGRTLRLGSSAGLGASAFGALCAWACMKERVQHHDEQRLCTASPSGALSAS